jgi:hypothetical protein
MKFVTHVLIYKFHLIIQKWRKVLSFNVMVLLHIIKLTLKTMKWVGGGERERRGEMGVREEREKGGTPHSAM